MTTTVATPSAEVEAMAPDWALVAALLGGTRAMRAAREHLLPRWPNEEWPSYECRLATAVLFPAYKRTVETLTGKPFSKPITMGDDVPQAMRPWLENIDLQGRNLDAFSAGVMEDALGYGMCGIMVEYPTKPEGVSTLADERALGLRPYWVHVRPQNLLGWRSQQINGAWQVTQLRLMEYELAPEGDFATVMIPQVRVLEPGKWTTYREVKDKKGEWTVYKEGATSLRYIPFVPVYGQRTGFMTAKPPLIEVANLNVKHWQSQSDQDTILHVARVPILAVVGADDDSFSLTVGASSAVKLPLGASMSFVEHTGAAIEAGKVSLDDLKEEMRQAGAELLVLTPGRQTATQVATENSVAMCALQRIVQGMEDALDTALQYTADWALPAKTSGGHVTIFSDFGAATLAEASAQLLLTANQAGKLSDETLHSEFQRRGILAADVNWEAEKERISEQGPALGVIAEPAEDAVSQ